MQSLTAGCEKNNSEKNTLLHVQINNCRSRKKRNHLYEYKVGSRLPSNLFSRFHCASSSWTGFSPSPWVSSRTKTRSLLTPPMALPPSCRILRWRWTSPGKQECQKHYHKTTKKEQQFLYNLNITHLLFLFFFKENTSKMARAVQNSHFTVVTTNFLSPDN